MQGPYSSKLLDLDLNEPADLSWANFSAPGFCQSLQIYEIFTFLSTYISEFIRILSQHYDEAAFSFLLTLFFSMNFSGSNSTGGASSLGMTIMFLNFFKPVPAGIK